MRSETKRTPSAVYRRALPADFPGALPAASDNSAIEQLADDELILRDRRGLVSHLTRTLAE
jgi:hypothetical protein